MSQDQLLILISKIVVVSGFLSLTGWIAQYTRYAKWWRNDVGRTLIAKTTLIAILLIPAMFSLFFNLNRFDSRIIGWLDVVLLGLVTPVMIWRILVFRKIHREEESKREK